MSSNGVDAIDVSSGMDMVAMVIGIDGGRFRWRKKEEKKRPRLPFGWNGPGVPLRSVQ
jgi:hypothetical protein